MAEGAQFPSAITSQLYQVVARKSTTLTSDVDSLNTNLAVVSTSGFPAVSFISVNNETMLATVLDGTNFTISRAYAGTAASHDEGDAVKLVVAAASINRIVLEIVATQTHIGTSGGTAGYVNARFLFGKTEPQLSVSDSVRLGGSTEGQLNVDLLDGIEAAAMNQLAVAQTIAAKKTYDEGCVIHAPKVYTPDAAGTATLDLALGNNHEITMPAGNITIAISNETDGQYFTIDLTQDATGSRTVTWFSTIKWAGGSAPTLTTTGNKRDSLGFKVTGEDTYDGFIIGLNV